MVMEHPLPQILEEYETFLSPVYRHTPNPGRIFVDGLKINSRVAALSAAGFPVASIIHFFRHLGDPIVPSMRSTGHGDWPRGREHALLCVVSTMRGRGSRKG